MPTYEYQCSACGHEFELFQQMSAAVKRKCPACGKNTLKRLIGTGAGIIFKGGGFYETDYRSDSYRKDAAADRKSGEKSSTGSSDTKTPDSGKGSSGTDATTKSPKTPKTPKTPKAKKPDAG
ncbi:MAG: zinc ribbon domain-containing protein [Planctomycetota bacterium]|nr:zinc ribbon domain-containing protein [Planctomycetota bacterium]